jgi:hypothetical protein
VALGLEREHERVVFLRQLRERFPVDVHLSSLVLPRI